MDIHFIQSADLFAQPQPQPRLSPAGRSLRCSIELINQVNEWMNECMNNGMSEWISQFK